jgi:TonB-linked SusC/RagA family outer membrane protein
MDQVTIADVLQAIQDQSEFKFFYNDQLVDVSRKVTVTARKKDIWHVLDQILPQAGITYRVVGKQVALFNTKGNKALQQQLVVSGVVTDEKGDPLPGVNIVEKGTTNGSITNTSGEYQIQVSAPNVTLVFSYVGYQTKEVAVDGQKNIDVVLKEDILGLEQVVVVGYGTQKKVNLTGAVDVVQPKQIENRPVINVSSALQGVSPNLNITTTRRGGEPGAGKDLNIRGVGSLTGSSSPYVLVDGVPMNINDVNPNDIESISVLKDAAASAIYGARAPYGVILITTKHGKKGEKIRISYDDNFSVNSPLNLPHMANSLDFATAYNESFTNAGQNPIYTDDVIDRIKQYLNGEITDETIVREDVNRYGTWYWGNANNDWMYLYYAPSVMSQKHDLSLRGGSQTTTYYVSAGYLNQPGQLRWGDEFYKRYNVTANLRTDVTKWLRFNFSTKYTRSLNQYPNAYGGYDRNVLYHNFTRQWPTNPLYFPDGQISPASNVHMLAYGGKDKRQTDDLWITLGGEIEPVKNWVTRINYSWNQNSYRRTNHHKTIYNFRPDGTKYPSVYPINQYFEWLGHNNYHLFNVTTSYQKQLGGHFLKLMLGYEEELKQNSGLSGNKKQLVTDAVPSISTATGDYNVDDWISHWATQGIFGRFNYNFKEKYLFEFNARYDGSSRFADGHRWGFFPSASVGYLISKEAFWSPISTVVNSFKIRASYGSLGNQNVPNYLYVPILPVRTRLPWIIGSERPVYTLAPGLISPSLTWETALTTDIGTDMAFLENRLGLVFDWYRRDTKNMFGPANALPRVLGASVPKENNAELSTKGWEVSLSWKDRAGKDFSYNVRVLLANSTSTVTKYNNPTNSLSTWYEGETIGEIWGLTTDHIIQDASEVDDMPDQSLYFSRWGPGDIMYKDLDGNDTINWGDWTADSHGDYSVIGNSRPRYTYSIIAGLEWKGIDFNMFWQGVGKRDVVFGPWDNIFFGFNGNMWQSTVMKPHLDYWRPADEENLLGPNTDAYYPKPYMSGEDHKNKRPQTRYLVSAAYMRLKNIQLGYTIPQQITQKVQIQKLRVYVSAENILTFTKLPKLFDPETIYGPWGVGKGHPISKGFSFGVNVTF